MRVLDTSVCVWYDMGVQTGCSSHVFKPIEIAVSLTNQEDMFCLGVIEYSGNLRMAYEVAFPAGEGETTFREARARELLAKPHIIQRIRDLMNSSVEMSFMSESAHMSELADIRDLSKRMGQPKTALAAEMARGQVAGYYKNKGSNTLDGLDGVDVDMVKSAVKLKQFVENVSQSLANQLPV